MTNKHENMSKVLISFLGTAQPKEREYRTANYRFNDGRQLTSSFIAKAIKQHDDIDKMFLVGTVKSMWEEVYRSFAGDGVDEDIYLQLSDHCTQARANSPLELPHRAAVEHAMGKGSKAVLIRYGLNEEEIEYNANVIFQLEQDLNAGDELYVDITHSFRSLPLFLMNCLIYLQNVSRRGVKIKTIYYGMLDVSGELGYTPVVELNNILTMNDWIIGAYAFANFGNAYKISELMRADDGEASERLNRFTELMSLNFLTAIKNEAQSLSSIRNKAFSSPMANMVVSPIIKDFIRDFMSAEQQSVFQFKLAQWHLKHKNYSSAYLTLIESIVTYVCECEHLDINDKDCRDEAKQFIWSSEEYSDLRRIFNRTNKIRISIAHQVERNSSYTNMIKKLEQSIEELKAIIK